MFDHDPIIRRAAQERRARNSVIRNAVIWTPLFVLTGGALIFFLIDILFLGGDRGTWFLVVILTILSFLFGYQSIQAIRDLMQGERTTEGLVTRRWARTDSLVLRSHYIRLNKNDIFRIDKLYHGDAAEGDYVRIRYYPHSAVVIELERLQLEEEDDDDGPDHPPADDLRRPLEWPG